jgi:SAM-dependent methyltransferase
MSEWWGSCGAGRLVLRAFYQWRYWTGQTPWDTNITPPELVAFVQERRARAGRALDLGCGTGTNSVFLARRGWTVIGVDFVGSALRAARRKAHAVGVQIEFRQADVLAPGAFDAPFDLVLDIGCLHNLDTSGASRYAANIRAWTQPGSTLLVYAFFPRTLGRRRFGISRDQMELLFAQDCNLVHYAADENSAWYQWERR